MKGSRRFLIFLLCTITIFGFGIINFIYVDANTSMKLVYDGKVHMYTAKPISLLVNKNRIQTKIMPPVILDNRTLVPAREVFEGMNAFVEWNANTKEVYVNYDETVVVLEAGKRKVWVDGENKQLDVPAKIINNKVMIPLRFVAESLGFLVKWDKGSRTVEVEKPVKPQPMQPIEPAQPIESQKPIVEQDTSSVIPPLPTVLAQNSSYWQTMNIDEGVDGTIQMGTYDKAQVVGISTVQNEPYKVTYAIKLKGELSSFSHTNLGDRLVVDINRADMKLDSDSSIKVDENTYINKIRVSQFEPEVARVVFDLKTTAGYKFTLSEDRQSLFVHLDKKALESIYLGQDGQGDYLQVNGEAPDMVQVYRMSDPQRIVVDLPMTVFDQELNQDQIGGQFIKQIRSGQHEDKFRIVIDVQNEPNFEVIKQQAEAFMIRLAVPTYKNLRYQTSQGPQLVIKKQGFSSGQMNIVDDYRKRKILITLPSNYQDEYGTGPMNIGGYFLKNIDIITTSDNKTQFVVNEQKVNAYTVIEDANTIRILFMNPKDKYGQIVVLDPGHGGAQPGASGNGIHEEDLNLTQALYAYQYLENDPNIKVYITRVDDSTVRLQERSALANEVDADFFLSVHNNAYLASHHGTELLYYPNPTDPRSKQIAGIMQNTIVSHVGTKNRGLRPRPDLYVLRTTNMPAILSEIAFLTNADDARRLKSDEFNRKVGKALYDGVVKIFETIKFR